MTKTKTDGRGCKRTWYLEEVPVGEVHNKGHSRVPTAAFVWHCRFPGSSQGWDWPLIRLPRSTRRRLVVDTEAAERSVRALMYEPVHAAPQYAWFYDGHDFPGDRPLFLGVAISCGLKKEPPW